MLITGIIKMLIKLEKKKINIKRINKKNWSSFYKTKFEEQTFEKFSKQLAGILSFILTQSLILHWVPRIWKDPVIVPVTLFKSPKTQNVFHPVSLTLFILKSFENTAKAEIFRATQSSPDPLQFIYTASWGCVNSLLHLVLYHFEGVKHFIFLFSLTFTKFLPEFTPYFSC